MNPIQKESSIEKACKNLGIKRLCHFTQSKNLLSIFGKSRGLLSRKTLENEHIEYHRNDSRRFEKREDLICCSIEYPNSYLFTRLRGLKDPSLSWVVLLIDCKYLWKSGTCFCPFNAANKCGEHIQPGIESFISLYADKPSKKARSRGDKHLRAAPTDIQAEVLVKEPIPLESIIGLAVESEKQAQQEACLFNSQGISIDKKILIAKDFFKKKELCDLIREGEEVEEIPYRNGDHHG